MRDIVITGRRNGLTTRTVDQIIQILFEKASVCVYSTHESSFNHLKGILLRRLMMEHRIDESKIIFTPMNIDESRARNDIFLDDNPYLVASKVLFRITYVEQPITKK